MIMITHLIDINFKLNRKIFLTNVYMEKTG